MYTAHCSYFDSFVGFGVCLFACFSQSLSDQEKEVEVSGSSQNADI